MTVASTPISVAVIGVGAFGRNHARVYRELEQAGEPVRLAALVDRDLGKASALVEQLGGDAPVPVFGSVADLLASNAQIAAASVAVPTIEHHAIATELMNAGIDVLIEKPLASTLAEADALVALAARTKRIAQVGHLERFNPAVQAAVPLVHTPMFFEVHRLSIFSPRALDVDVVLDLMIHDLDIVLSLVHSPLREVRAVGIPILSSKVDIANARLEFDSGCVANFTASRVSTERVRKLRLFQPHQYVSLDYSRQDVFTLSVETAKPGDPAPAEAAQFPPMPLPAGMRIVPSRPAVASEEPLHAELRAFLEAVRARRQPAVTLEDGRRALDVAFQILDQIAEHSERANLGAMARPQA
jgi:predicted dehydrogenase